MVRRGLYHLVRQTRSESGQSLVLAFIVMFALSITVGGVISFTTSNESQFGRDRQLDRAFHIAEAGLNNGIEVVEKTDPSNDSSKIGLRVPATGTYPLSLDGGLGSYYVQKYTATSPECTTHAGSAPNACWVVIATGHSPDGKILKELQESIYWRTVTVPIDDDYGYGLFVDNPPGSGDCVDTHGTATLDIDNIWINGDFCPAGDAGFEPTADSVGSVYIGGTYEGRNNTNIGTSSKYYGTVNIAGGCTVQGKVNNCDQSANIYSRDVAPGAAGSALQKPDIATAAAALYASADWTHPTCTPAGTASPFDDPAHPGPNQSMGTVTLFSGSSYDCSVVDTSGVTHRLAWNSTTQTLSVKNGVYIDGNVDFPNSASTYSIGNFSSDNAKTDGTIYVNGVMNGSSNVNICGPGSLPASPSYGCPLRWDPTQGSLAFAVVNPLALSTGFSMTGNGELDATIIVNQGYADTGGTIVAGPVLADRATVGGNGGFVVPNNPPSGTPTDVTTQASWVVQPGAWKETK
jgi:Tfp pilus assembly protein PilX